MNNRLVTRPDVDPRRLAFIGHTHGAAMGGLLAGAEDRITAYALAISDGGLVPHSSGSGPDAATLSGPAVEVRQQWLTLMTPIEPLQFIGRAGGAAVSGGAGKTALNPPITARANGSRKRQRYARLDRAWYGDCVGARPPTVA